MKNTTTVTYICFVAFLLSGVICFLHYHRTYPTVTFTQDDHIALDPVHSAAYLIEDSQAQPIADINSASAETLAVLPCMDEILAARVVNYRMNFGSFSKTEDIMKVNGITRDIYTKIRPYICADKPN